MVAFVAIVLVAIALVAMVFWMRWDPQIAAERSIQQAAQLRNARQFEQAETMAWQAWEADATRDDAAMLAAKCAEDAGRYVAAIEYAEKVQDRDRSIYLAAKMLIAEIGHRQLRRFQDAELAYAEVLKHEPAYLPARLGLANLLGMCGRRADAVPHVIQLIQQGQAEDLLILLAREKGIIGSPQELEETEKSRTVDPNRLMGLAWHSVEANRPSEAIAMLKEAISVRPGLWLAHLALGEIYADQGDFVSLAALLSTVPKEPQAYAEYWVLRGRLADERQDTVGAIRCYAEASIRSPELKRPATRLSQLLDQAGEADLSSRFALFAQKLQALNKFQDHVFFANTPNGIDTLLELIGHYEQVGRYWEALGWCTLAGEIQGNHPQIRSALQRIRLELTQMPMQLAATTASPIHSFERERFPLSAIEAVESVNQVPAVSNQFDNELAFREEAAETGLKFQYFNGTDGTPTRRMYEFTGGGIGVIDYDMDGWSDCYLSQGCVWPPESIASSPYVDRLFRNRDGKQFVNVGESTGISDDGFGQGVTVGDFNADGFPDLYVANIGRNRLLQNNGDGTFTDVTEEVGIEAKEWTTSCVMADLSGDGLADLYDANYVTADDVFDRVCQDASGHPQMCMPFDFSPQQDRLWLNDGQGTFVDATGTYLSKAPLGKGLGVAVVHAEGTDRLALFVANDTTPNFLFVPEERKEEGWWLRERGAASGVAFNSDGKAEGSMGVAVGDVDQNGHVDLLVTNYLNESNTLYMAMPKAMFVDRTNALGIREPSMSKLGFGTQFLDVDADGQCELFVANGHIDDLTHQGRPYEMEPQLLRLTSNRFQEVGSAGLGEYFQQKWLGRAAVKWDWNRDGRMDLLVGNLRAPTALLTNVTQATGNYLTLRLVGVQSNRDAIGTRVRATIKEQTTHFELTAGDGYQASNERRVFVGMGKSLIVDELRVLWPSGQETRLANVAANQELLVVEGR